MEDYVPSDGKYVTGAASIYPAYLFNMSARALARFALLYLHDGKWQDRQVVPAHWVAESTHPYSQSAYGPGYAYLWWTGFLDESIAPTVTLPPGTFAAWGAGGQYAYVMPAFDLVVVHRTLISGDAGPGLREFGRLLWLVLMAGRFPDIGPDASIDAAHGIGLDDATLAQLLPAKTILYGEGVSEGPYRIRFNRDGTMVALKGKEPAQYDTGTWHVEGGRICREWEKTKPQHLCLAVVADASHVELFDDKGLMFINARLSDD
jgi:hypothetical protein